MFFFVLLAFIIASPISQKRTGKPFSITFSGKPFLEIVANQIHKTLGRLIFCNIFSEFCRLSEFYIFGSPENSSPNEKVPKIGSQLQQMVRRQDMGWTIFFCDFLFFILSFVELVLELATLHNFHPMFMKLWQSIGDQKRRSPIKMKRDRITSLDNIRSKPIILHIRFLLDIGMRATAQICYSSIQTSSYYKEIQIIIFASRMLFRVDKWCSMPESIRFFRLLMK